MLAIERIKENIVKLQIARHCLKSIKALSQKDTDCIALLVSGIDSLIDDEQENIAHLYMLETSCAPNDFQPPRIFIDL